MPQALPAARWLRGYVERCLAEIWGVSDLSTDRDCDWPFRSEYGGCFVSLETAPEPWMVQVFGYAAYDVKRSARLLTELTELTCHARAVSVYWTEGSVVVRLSILAAALDRPTLEHALDSVTSVIDEIAPMIASVYGGQTPYVPDPIDRS